MSTPVKIILGVVLVLALVLTFLFTFLLNKKTKVPPNCPKVDIGCAGCLLNCSKRDEDASISKVTSNIVSNFSSKKDEAEDEKKEDTEKKGGK